MKLECGHCGNDRDFWRVWTGATVVQEIRPDGTGCGPRQISELLKDEDAEVECMVCGSSWLIVDKEEQ